MRQREGINTRGEGSRSLVNKRNKHRIQRERVKRPKKIVTTYSTLSRELPVEQSMLQ